LPPAPPPRMIAPVIHVPTAPWAHLVFDLLAWSAGIGTGLTLYRWRLAAMTADIAAKVGAGYYAALAGGAALGAWMSGSLNTLRIPDPVLSHSIAGALAGAIIGVEFYKAARGVKGSTGGVFVGSFTVGVVIGRFGCLFAGLPDQTFGTPTALPWGVDLGDGIARHPVQLYESAAMAAFLAVYLLALSRRAPWASRRAFYVMCIWYGAQRFAWEFLKPYPPLIGPYNVFHLLCLGLVIYGSIFACNDWRRARNGALSVPGADHQPV
jgi:phosphatidylglycerol:prolipoprotein diacylglycerol transferase